MTATARAVIEASELPEHEAIRLLTAVTGLNRAVILTDTTITDDQREAFDELVERRLGGEPLQYIEGEVPFGSVVLKVDERVLIPRPETEELLHLAIDLADDPSVIVDLCTGSGNLAVALAASFPDAQVFATDIAPAAAEAARENARLNGVAVTVLDGDLFGPLPADIRGRVDLVVANPPYLSEDELADVPGDVSREPKLALVGGEAGPEIVERIANDVATWLKPAGVVLCEISEFDAQQTLGLFDLLAAELRTDMFGKDRFVVAHARVE